ncbi:MAG: hypothetical protein ABS79_05550 [Planctomycetes bacterium SCN 63-9]|nr:MAG: hypothetical protein ABS79_05550 [Planctomycetes bacterium SCN 63-9]
MLVLSRKRNASIVIDGCIRVTVLSIRGNQVRLGIEAPEQVAICRKELCPDGRERPALQAKPRRFENERVCLS